MAHLSIVECDVILDRLIDEYPNTFTRNNYEKFPLKRDIINDLLLDGAVPYGKDELIQVLNRYNSHIGIQFAIRNRRGRKDLSGNIVSQVAWTEPPEGVAPIRHHGVEG